MRKLYLASFKFRTGENQYEDFSLLAIDVPEHERFVDTANRAYQQFFGPWFSNEYPNSECVSFILKPTIPFDTAHIEED